MTWIGSRPLRRTHHDAAAPALEVAALDQLDAHRAGEQGVLEVGAVEDAGRQHDDGRVGDPGRCRGAQRREQLLRVAGDRADPVVAERLGDRRGDRAAVGHHVGDPGRHADVVLEHPELAVVVADQVDPADVHAHPVGRLDPGRLAVEVRGGGDHAARYDAVVEDPAGVVHVVEEALERLHALLDAGLDPRPLVHLDHAGQDVERERPLLAADVEGDALVEVAVLERVDPAVDLGRRHLLQRAAQPGVRRAQVVAVEHLVVRLTHGVAVALRTSRPFADPSDHRFVQRATPPLVEMCLPLHRDVAAAPPRGASRAECTGCVASAGGHAFQRVRGHISTGPRAHLNGSAGTSQRGVRGE